MASLWDGGRIFISAKHYEFLYYLGFFPWRIFSDAKIKPISTSNFLIFEIRPRTILILVSRPMPSHTPNSLTPIDSMTGKYLYSAIFQPLGPPVHPWTRRDPHVLPDFFSHFFYTINSRSTQNQNSQRINYKKSLLPNSQLYILSVSIFRLF